MTAYACAECGADPEWEHKPTGRLLCDEHAAPLDLDDLEEIWSTS